MATYNHKNMNGWYGWDVESGKCIWYTASDNSTTDLGTNFQTSAYSYPQLQDVQNLSVGGANENRQYTASYVPTPLESNEFSHAQWEGPWGSGSYASDVQNYTPTMAQTQHGAYPTHMSSNGQNQWTTQRTASYAQPDQHNASGYMAPALHGATAPSTDYDNYHRSRGSQTSTMPTKSTMQEFLARRLRDTAPSTLTTSTDASAISGSSAGTFSSVSSYAPSDFRNRQDAYQPSRLSQQLSQMRITENVAELGENIQTFHPSWPTQGGHENAMYGQRRAPMTITPGLSQGPCDKCRCDCGRRVHSCPSSQPPLHGVQYSSHGDNHPTERIQIGYCPIRDCNRGPGSRRPFPRTCNLLEHLRGVHKEEIPRGAKLRVWLVEQGYDPDLLVATVKPRP